MIKPLTSLRFFFALLVFLCHLSFLGDSEDSLGTYLYTHFFSEGQIGVSFFFMLSGFILAYTYKRKLLRGETSKKTFWIARFARVYPLHIVTMIIAIPYAIITLNTNKLDWAVISISQLSLTQSFLPFTSFYFSLNGPAWSISCEAFFYLMFPFIIKWLWERNNLYKSRFFMLVIIAMILIPFTMAYTSKKWHTWIFYVNPLVRIVDFIIGILIHEIYRKHHSAVTKIGGSIMEITSIAIFVIFFYQPVAIPEVYKYSVYFWVPMAMVLISFSFQKGILSYIISKQIFIVLGEISFAFYLIHQPVIRYLQLLNNNYKFTNNNFTIAFSMFCISLTLAYLLHKLIEVPANKWIKRICTPVLKQKKAYEYSERKELEHQL